MTDKEKKEYQKRWYIQNKDKIKTRNKAYYDNNKDILKKWQERYYMQNKDSILKRQKEYRKNNKESIKERDKEWYTQHKDSILKSNKEYRKKRWKNDKEYREKRIIYNSEFKHKQFKTDKQFRERTINMAKERYSNKMSITSKQEKPMKFSYAEKEYIVNNYNKKTYLEIALEIKRSYSSISGFIYRQLRVGKLKRKNKIYKGICY